MMIHVWYSAGSSEEDKPDIMEYKNLSSFWWLYFTLRIPTESLLAIWIMFLLFKAKMSYSFRFSILN